MCWASYFSGLKKKVINILKYLNLTTNYKITYKGQGELIVYSDDPDSTSDQKKTENLLLDIEY